MPSRLWTLLLPSLLVVPAVHVQRPHPPLRPRRIIGNRSALLQASLHSSSASAGVGLEQQLSTFLCRGQRKPAALVHEHRNLTFIHIPRCAGTTIEDCTQHEAAGWGHLDLDLHGLYKITKRFNCFKQHVPPSLMPGFYQGKATFCVVRNPYERMISEYHYPLTRGFSARAKAGRCNKEGLNEFAVEALTAMKEKGDPYMHDCHLLPQASYVYGWDVEASAVTRGREPWCKHVLRQERLKADFNGMMEEYGYTYRLTNLINPSTVAGPAWHCTHVTPEDFGPEARKLINEFWKDDFELFNFSMLPVTGASATM
mmetsp:Transcript_5506/g.15634  ORF Transcript_5506/g.15634 Transcript_5506/m.15634 type:complete len:313 (-) Transcript_5506:45-983(-)